MVRGRRRAKASEGYSLVFLVVLIALMSIAATATLPALKKQIDREKEAELIFRGLQYAEAIRVFQKRFGRYPNTLDELIKLEPRSIRQLWSDPMTPDGRWALILASGGQQGQNDGRDGTGGGQNTEERGRELGGGSAPASSFQLGSGGQPQRPVGPILGVVSRQKGLATRTFLGKDIYTEWRFTANIIPTPQVVPGTDLIKGGSVLNLGKPFPRGLQPVGLAPQSEDLASGRAPSDAFDDDGDDG